MMSKTDVQQEFALDMPEAYKKFLAQKKRQQWLFGFGWYVILLAVYYVAWQHGHHIIDFLPQMMIWGLSLPLWLNGRKRPWKYTLDDKRLCLVSWQWKENIWAWYDLAWRNDVILSIEKEEWRSLPALRIQAKLKGHKREQTLWLVYSHQDQQTVNTQLMPLIDRYRRQYRHKLWADLLRS